MSIYIDGEDSLQEQYNKLLQDYERMAAEYYKDSMDYNERILQLKDEIEEYRSALSVLSLYVSAGIGDDTITPKQYVDRIKSGITLMVAEFTKRNKNL